MLHVQEILRALHLDTIHTEYYSFRSKEAKPQVQIYLIIDRSDGHIDIIEVKYSKSVYSMPLEESIKIAHRRDVFENESKTKKGTQCVLITTFGCTRNENSDVCQKFIQLDDLF